MKESNAFIKYKKKIIEKIPVEKGVRQEDCQFCSTIALDVITKKIEETGTINKNLETRWRSKNERIQWKKNEYLLK